MPITCGWMNEDRTLIRVRLEGKIEGEDILAADAEVRGMMDGVAHPVDVISDYSQQIYFSPNYVQTTQRLTGFERENLRVLVMMGSEFAWALFEAYSREYGGFAFQTAYAADWDAAQAIVQRVRTGARYTVQPPPFAEWN